MNRHVAVERARVAGGDPPPRLAVLAGAAVIGTAAALTVTSDSLLAQRMDFDGLDLSIPRAFLFPVTTGVALAVLLALALVAGWRPLFRHRIRINIAVVVIFAMIPGFHYGPIHPSGFGLVFSVLFLVALILVEHWPMRRDGFALAMIAVMTLFVFTSVISGKLAAIVSAHTVLTKFALVLVVSGLIRDRATLRWTIALIVGLAVASAVLAVASLFLYSYTGYELTYDDLMEVKATPIGMMMRATAFFSTTQGLGHALILTTCLVIFYPVRGWLRAAMIGVLGLGIAGTFSAGAYGATAVAFGLAPFLAFPRRALHIAAGMMAVALACYASGLYTLAMQQVLLPLGAGNAEERLEFIDAGLQAIGREPWLGYGVKNIGRILDTAVHNAYVQMMADVGILGGAAFVAFLAHLAITAGLVQRRAGPPADRALSKGLFLGVVVMAYHFISEPFYDNTFSWLFLGITMVNNGLNPPRRRASGSLVGAER